MRRAHARHPVCLGAGRQQTLEQANTQTTQRDTHAGQQQDRRSSNGGGSRTDPADGGGENTGDGSNDFSHVCNFLSLDFQGSGQNQARALSRRLNRPTPRPHRGIPTQASSRIGSSAIVDATVPTQPIAAVNTEPMEVSRELTVTAATSVVWQRSFR